MTNKSRPLALLIQLEFPNWQRARSWSFSAHCGVRDALLANGVECFTVPAIADIPPTSAASWLFHIKKLCAGRRFDQAWVWLVHTPLDDSILDWLTTVAPVRIGILMESLRYDHEDYAVAPHLLNRPAVVQRLLHYLTHLLAPDEYDAVELRVHQSTRALWWPGTVPERCVADDWTPPTNPYAVFQGAVYGQRRNWITHPTLHSRMSCPLSQGPTESQRLFDLLQQTTLTMLQSGVEVTERSLSEYVENLCRIRSAEFTEYMKGLVQWTAVVNLPSMAKFYGARVFEGMAAGRPVISWDISNRPRSRALFESGQEILLYDKSSPEALADQIDRLQRDPGFAKGIAKNARDKIRRYHTTEVRMGQVLRWIETGEEPDYGEQRSPETAESAATLAVAQSSSSLGHIAVRGSESSRSAPIPVEAATKSGALFIKPGYTARSRPEYFLDQLAGVIWQPDVYPMAAFLGHQLGCSHIIDIGCGHGEKLMALYPQFQVIGIDFGPNIQYCRQNYPSGQWVELNLETESTLPVDPAILKRSIVVCADVIEHLIDPTGLIHAIKTLMDHAPVAILTTPERDLTWGPAHYGPPPNPCHVREWNLEELRQLLCSEGLNPLFLGLTINNDSQRKKETSIALIGNNCGTPTGVLLEAIEVAAARWLDRAPQAGLKSHESEGTAVQAITRVAQSAEARQGVRQDSLPERSAVASDPPLVSVVVPTFNRPDTLIDALRSILNQTYQEFEIIVVNDGGSDVENIVRFLDKDGRITYIRHGGNRNLAAARNTAIKVARGKYIAYLDDDDLFYPDHLETLVTLLQQSGQQVAYTDAHRAHQEKRDGRYVVTKREIAYSLDFDYDRILVHNFVPVLCFMHERACLDAVGLFDESLSTHEDWELWIRMSRRFQFAHIKKVTCEFASRADGSNMSSSKLPDFRRTMAIILERHLASTSEKPHVRAAQERVLQQLRGGTVGVNVGAQPAESQQVVALLQQADEHCKTGDLQRAREILGQALEVLPDDPQLLLTMGNIALRLGDVEEARREFVKVAVLHPDYAPAHADLAAVLLHLGRAEEAEASARRTLELDSTNVGALKILARICLDTERYQEAVQAYATILQHAPDDIETLILVGNCYAETGRFEQARGFYGKALGLDPGNQIVRENLAEVDKLAAAASAKGEMGTVNGSRSEACPSASIVVVTYNSAATVRACLDSVLCESRSVTELIVVDNASTDETRAILESYRDRATVILNPKNRGFSAACNQGVRASTGQYVVLLNPDTVVTPGWLDRLISHIGPGVGAVGPVSNYVAGLQKYQLYDPGPSTDRTVAAIAERMAQANCGRAVETRLLIGFCFLIPRKVLDEVGSLDEELFLGNDDLDLSWRLRLKGYKLLVATDSFIHHEGQVSFKSEAEMKTSRLVQESTDRLYAKLEAHYGADNVPSPMELWGIDWFKPTPPTPHSSLLTSIIILTYNGLEHTKKCLTSIEALTPEPHEVIIIDNGSTDGTLDYLRDYAESRENVRVIANRGNRGFAAGNNQGLAQAQGNYLLLLNNDTVVTSGWLGRMLAVFDRHPEVGIVGPVSNYVIDGPQLLKNPTYTSILEMQAFASRWAADHAGQSRPIKRVVGFCLLMRRAVVDRIGGLDERFGSGNFEDDDLCLRAAQVGFAARVAEDVFIHHTGSQTFKATGIDYRQSMERNWELFKAKWGIPRKSRVEQGYRLPLRLVNGADLAVSLPDLGACYDAEMSGRWWAERQDSGAPAATSHGVAENGRAGHDTAQGAEGRCSALVLTGEGT